VGRHLHSARDARLSGRRCFILRGAHGGRNGGRGGGRSKQEIDVFLARSGGNDFRRAGRPSGAIDNDREIARGARGRENERRLSTDSPWSSHGCQESRGESDKSVTPLGRQTGGGGQLPSPVAALGRGNRRAGSRARGLEAPLALADDDLRPPPPPPAPAPPARRIPLPSPRGFSL